jgi:hypothetical protein
MTIESPKSATFDDNLGTHMRLLRKLRLPLVAMLAIMLFLYIQVKPANSNSERQNTKRQTSSRQETKPVARQQAAEPNGEVTEPDDLANAINNANVAEPTESARDPNSESVPTTPAESTAEFTPPSDIPSSDELSVINSPTNESQPIVSAPQVETVVEKKANDDDLDLPPRRVPTATPTAPDSRPFDEVIDGIDITRHVRIFQPRSQKLARIVAGFAKRLAIAKSLNEKQELQAATAESAATDNSSASHEIDAEELVLRNASRSGTVAFLIDREIRRLPAGQEVRFQKENARTIRFHRGGNFGESRHSLESGSYIFRAGQQGWELVPTESVTSSQDE